jgi:hypothetical protein
MEKNARKLMEDFDGDRLPPDISHYLYCVETLVSGKSNSTMGKK